jgi:hypothetical protein
LKNLLAISLVIILLVPFWGTMGYLQFQKKLHRKEIKRQLQAGVPRENLVEFRISREDSFKLFKWKHEGEFEYQGRMFDIVEKEVSSDSLIYHCIPDHRESWLNREANRLLARSSGSDPSKQSQTEKLHQFLKTLIAQQTDLSLHCYEHFSAMTSPILSDHYTSFFSAPPGPPPKFI